ncbi:hypothetical protein LYNGBM3L_59600 [Moorena producens 3L]|uniref:Uncharacterized protein n=1 Tax=Moorena producens 3L TaxID=489825 RepID=F4XZU4_9CYAN|nr:hypothetical protein LYNGBM3L_59600 [Moorena producens 3L]
MLKVEGLIGLIELKVERDRVAFWPRLKVEGLIGLMVGWLKG